MRNLHDRVVAPPPENPPASCRNLQPFAPATAYRTPKHLAAITIVLGLWAGFSLPSGAQYPASTSAASPTVLSPNLVPTQPTGASRCDRCHTLDPLFSHPVGMAPSMPLPAQFPLEHGLMTCATCHAVDLTTHPLTTSTTAAPRHSTLRESHKSLRSSPGFDSTNSFCIQCHQKPAFTSHGRDKIAGSSTPEAAPPGPISGSRSGDPSHASAPIRAHLEGADRAAVARALSTSTDRNRSGRFATPDSESAACMECHDGVTATDAGHTPVAPSDRQPQTLADGHAVGFPYTGRATDPDASALAHPSRVDPRIRFFDRSIGCGSCHSLYSPEPNRLVLTNQGSRLCLSCHEM